MRIHKWAAVAVMVVFVGCAKDEGGDTAEETAPPAETPAPEQSAPAPAVALPAGVTQDEVTQGQQIFTSTGNCFTCHGPDAKGGQLAPNLTDSEWLNVDGTFDQIQDVIKNGVPTPKQHPAPMPAMGGAQLSDDQVKQVAAYVYSLGGGK